MTESPRKVIQQEVDVVAAHPGFNLLTRMRHQDGVTISLRRRPILAWAISREVFERCGGNGFSGYRDITFRSFTIPLTIDGWCEDDDLAISAVEYPDGRCDVRRCDPRCRHDQPFESAAELLQHWEAEARAIANNAVEAGLLF